MDLPASTTHTHNPDGTVTLSLTLPAESVTRLTWVAEQAADAYRRGSDEDDELLFGEQLLSPLSALLWRADHADPVCPDAVSAPVGAVAVTAGNTPELHVGTEHQGLSGVWVVCGCGFATTRQTARYAEAAWCEYRAHALDALRSAVQTAQLQGNAR